jgi:hypothetical protein
MTMLHPLFVADVPEGFEGTLDQVFGRVEIPDLNDALGALRSQVAALRLRIEEAIKRTEAGQVKATPGIGGLRCPLPG